MPTAYFDCFNGAGGDMIVAALIDAGADADALRTGLESLGLGGYSLSIERVSRRGIAATRFDVRLNPETPQPHRRLADIHAILDASDLAPAARERAKRIFDRLGQAEAKVHGIPIEQVHFHEVGAVDAILDVVGAVLTLDLLGIRDFTCSPIPTGSGTVECAHGTLPVPAPATAELLQGVPLATSMTTGELTTPTAAAILTTLASGFGPRPPMTVRSVGHGAGSREGGPLPNLLRVFVGESAEQPATDHVTILETTLDDASGQIVGHCMERLLESGALDVWVTPITMKKSRPGLVLTALCEPARAAELERLIFAETPTLGIRRRRCERVTMSRQVATVQTTFGPIRVKVGRYDDLETASPEYDDCVAAAVAHGVALHSVMSAARHAWEAERHP